MKNITVPMSALFLIVLTGVAQPQLVHSQAGMVFSQAGGQRVGGTDGGGVDAPNNRVVPGTQQPGGDNGGDQAGDSEHNGQPAPRRRWVPRPPSGPGCPYRERQLELIV